MKQKEIVQLATNDIKDKLKEEQGIYIKLKIGHGVSPIENPMKITAQRKLVARLKTEIRKRELAELKK